MHSRTPLRLLEDFNSTSLLEYLEDERTSFEKLRDDFFKQLEQGPPATAEGVVDPLTEDESSPWQTLRKDEELRDEIQQDIERTYPDNDYYRSKKIQDYMLNVLFVYCKLNPDVSYRQGMHEILAPILWVTESDAIEPLEEGEMESVSLSDAGGGDYCMNGVLNRKYVEHDAYLLFKCVMKFAKAWYKTSETASLPVGDQGSSPAMSPIVKKSKYIHEELLMSTDPELARHLKDLDVLPQVFLILMFGREFLFDDLLRLWDGIFVEDKELRIIDHICVAMLLRIRWELIKADYSTALMCLLRYPPPAAEYPPITFLMDAIYLKDNLSSAGGSHIISKYSGKAPVVRKQSQSQIQRPVTPPPKKSTLPASPISPRSLGVSMPSLNLEGLVQDVAKNMFERSEKWGVNRALREAMGEVRRVSQGVGDQQREMYTKWKEGEDRQKVLGGLLEVSLGILDEMVDSLSPNGGDLESMDDKEKKREAVARVRYVKDCLLDSKIEIDQRWLGSLANSRRPSFQAERTKENEPSLPDTAATPLTASVASSSAASSRSNTRSSSPYRTLPTRKPPPFPTYSPSAIQTTASAPSTNPHTPITSPLKSAIPSISPSTTTTANPLVQQQRQIRKSVIPSGNNIKPPPFNRSPTQTRRSLAQSEFSWMLGDDTAHRNRAAFLSDGENEGRRSSDGGLFGDGQNANSDSVFDMGLLGRKR